MPERDAEAERRARIDGLLGTDFQEGPAGRAFRPRSAVLTHYRRLCPEWSRKTVTRWVRAVQLMRSAGWETDFQRAIVEQYTSVDGAMRVDALLEYVEEMVFWQAHRGA